MLFHYKIPTLFYYEKKYWLYSKKQQKNTFNGTGINGGVWSASK